MNTTEERNSFDFDIISLTFPDGESFDKKILYWDERSKMSVIQFINSFTKEEINRMAECLENRRYDSIYTNCFVSHFNYTYENNDRISIIHDYLRCVLIDCLSYDAINAFEFYSKQFFKFLSIYDYTDCFIF